MAPKFSSTRSFLSNDLLELEEYREDGDKILDLGCGNGRFFEMLDGKNIEYTGADVSNELVKIARKKYPSTTFDLLKDPIKLPYGSNKFDKVFMLAVFHHIPGREVRIEYLREILNVLKPKGQLILTCWNLLENKNIRRKLFKNNILRMLKSNSLGKNDILIDFKDGDKILAERYIHCFSESELIRDFEQAGYKVLNSKIMRRGKRGLYSNILVIGQKEQELNAR